MTDPSAYALTFSAGWCPVDPDPDAAPAAVTALVERVPEFAPHTSDLTELLAAGCVHGADAEVVAMVAAPVGDRFAAGLMFVRIRANPHADLAEALAAAERELGGVRLDGLAEADVVALPGGLAAVRVRRLREAPGPDGPRMMESLGYRIPAPSGEALALLDFATPDLDAGELLVLAADVVAASFAWTELPA